MLPGLGRGIDRLVGGIQDGIAGDLVKADASWVAMDMYCFPASCTKIHLLERVSRPRSRLNPTPHDFTVALC